MHCSKMAAKLMSRVFRSFVCLPFEVFFHGTLVAKGYDVYIQYEFISCKDARTH